MKSGTQLGHYEITAQIGKGGMGEVYRARDTKLGREVAIKVLPSEFSRDAERLARLEREARMLAALNHPNIAAIYGLEESDDTRFLVLELVEGDTLADRLRHGAIPVEESLKLALQIAEALESAHEKGVVHRDLKPGNIKITPDGRVKVLDFGLAKAFVGDQADVNLSNSPTLSMAATQAGIILGTAAYMSPEQASGKDTDQRSDVWAFGVVLFEMLSGRALFSGETATEVLASVLKDAPDWGHLPLDLNPRVRFLLERCLTRPRKERCQGIAEARAEIGRVLSDPGGVPVRPSVQPGAQAGWKTDNILVAVSVVLLVVLAFVVGGGGFWSSPGIESSATRYLHLLPGGEPFNNPGTPVLAVAPAGDQIAYSAGGGLFVFRPGADFEARRVSGTETDRAESPVFSPDGEWIAYWAAVDGWIKKVPVAGGTPIPITPTSNPLGPTWSSEDMILYAQARAVWQVPASGGEPERLFETDSGSLYEPYMLPDGNRLMYVWVPQDGGSSQVVVRTLGTDEDTTLFAGDRPRYLESGHLVYVDRTRLMVRTFDPGTLEYGEAVPFEEMARLASGSAPQYAISRSGTLAYVPAFQPTGRRLGFLDPSGAFEPIEGIAAGEYENPSVSPDGLHVAVQARRGGRSAIFVYDLSADSEELQLTFESNSGQPVWTPDGERITYSSDRDGIRRIWWERADGSGVADPLTTPEPGQVHLHPVWAPDGRLVYTVSTGAEPIPAEGDLWIVDVPDGTPQPLIDRSLGQVSARFSADGQRMAYVQGTTGNPEVWVEPFPPTGARTRVPGEGGTNSAWPVWSRDGSRLYFHTNEGAVSLDVPTPGLAFRDRRVTPLVAVGQFRRFDTVPDDDRLLAVLPPTPTLDAGGPMEIRVVQNWIEELLQLMPASE